MGPARRAGCATVATRGPRQGLDWRTDRRARALPVTLHAVCRVSADDKLLASQLVAVSRAQPCRREFWENRPVTAELLEHTPARRTKYTPAVPLRFAPLCATGTFAPTEKPFYNEMTETLMRWIGPTAIACSLLALGVPGYSRAQKPIVSVAVDFSDSSRQFSSAFAAALRQLGDVAVVPISDEPEYVISGLAMCLPDCTRVLSYSVAIRLYAPMQRGSAKTLAVGARKMLGVKQVRGSDSLAQSFYNRLRPFELTFSLGSSPGLARGTS
jgi:hypothetical protein